jgi:hypothetical protein
LSNKIEELRALLAKETTEEWQVEYDKNDQANIYGASNDDWIALLPHQCVTSIEKKMQNRAALIVAMQNALPNLLDVVEKAEDMRGCNGRFGIEGGCTGCGVDEGDHDPSCEWRALDAALAKLKGAT